MPRPQISDDIIKAIDTWVEPNIDIPIEKLSTEDKLDILLRNHKKLHRYKLNDSTESHGGIIPPDVNTPTMDEE